ncbi:hypothetical protein [Salmonella enterica]|uniref:hypothetical protein n=1 Tax=Salmonella enterica TaxID=28901 RepID=UPI003D7C287D
MTNPAGSGKGDAGKTTAARNALIRNLIMMPEYGHALLCTALGVALLLSVYPLWGVARDG